MTHGQPSASGRGPDERWALVVEREGQARELEAHFLRELGLQVEIADNGVTALEKARQLHPELVLSEILIPKLDGLALCRQLKRERETKDIPVLLVSVLSATSRARDAGAEGFLLKPISQGRLAAEVARLVPPAQAKVEAQT
jgi:CheY-like chemotaxis protein